MTAPLFLSRCLGACAVRNDNRDRMLLPLFHALSLKIPKILEGWFHFHSLASLFKNCPEAFQVSFLSLAFWKPRRPLEERANLGRMSKGGSTGVIIMGGAGEEVTSGEPVRDPDRN